MELSLPEKRGPIIYPDTKDSFEPLLIYLGFSDKFIAETLNYLQNLSDLSDQLDLIHIFMMRLRFEIDQTGEFDTSQSNQLIGEAYTRRGLHVKRKSTQNLSSSKISDEFSLYTIVKSEGDIEDQANTPPQDFDLLEGL